MNSAFGVDNLSASEFINASGKAIKSFSNVCGTVHQGSHFPALVAGLIQLRKMLTLSEIRFTFNFTCDFLIRISILQPTKWKILAHQKNKESSVCKEIRRILLNSWRRTVVVFCTSYKSNQQYPAFWIISKYTYQHPLAAPQK